ncbi:antA/AntB antirepressor family protein [Metabacillus fastidiosus]|uniref:AntA/AntB antirepressor family protein n=1 Tax=Metabacillus fastidiosus TaxID=1458 RepID=A0ABU6NSU6_9BACI|nr:antA/AntB antirepressor family protein [Metabacillus fastidiosus]
MNELIKTKTNENNEVIVSGRVLHEFLEVKTPYKQWFDRIKEYGFVENVDFTLFTQKCVSSNSSGFKVITDHALKLDTAKEISMIQRNEKGKLARQYFIEIERRWNSPEMIMKRAMDYLNQRVEQLMTTNLELEEQVTTMQPKADYFNRLVDRNLLTNFRDTAKEIKVKQNIFIQWLLDQRYIYRDKRNQLKPYAKYVPEFFELKEWQNNSRADTQTLITPKGRETFRLLCKF